VRALRRAPAAMTRDRKVAAFRALHAGEMFVMPNVWDAGGAQLFAGLGFPALATTSAGYAIATGRRDGRGEVDRDDALAHAGALVRATDLPVTADLENGYGDAPEAVAETVIRAAEAGLAGISIEDVRPDRAAPVYDRDAAVARIEAAVGAAREVGIVLTARADGMLARAYAFDEAVTRLQAFEAVGAEVLYAPGVPGLVKLKALCAAVGRPVNHVIGLGAAGASRDELAAAGVARVSLGGSLARLAYGALFEAGRAMGEGRFDLAEAGAGWGEILAAMKAGRPEAP
ncbi:MAG: isocitrate lyase/phosphoenolpyruvate mutase family protein, partial [Paracoccaceae bacterium]